MLEQGWQVPFSPYRLVRTSDFEQLIGRMRISVPSSIRESERTIMERDRIIAEAQAEAERLVQQAKQRATEMLSERSLLSIAQLEAERVVEESKQVARQRTEEADQYAIHVLEELAQQLGLTMQQVENGLRIMQEGISPPAPQRPPNPNPLQRRAASAGGAKNQVEQSQASGD